MAKSDEIAAAVGVIEQWHGVVDVEFLAKRVIEAVDEVRAETCGLCGKRYHEHDPIAQNTNAVRLCNQVVVVPGERARNMKVNMKMIDGAKSETA